MSLTMDMIKFADKKGNSVPYVEIIAIKGLFNEHPVVVLTRWQTDEEGLKTGHSETVTLPILGAYTVKDGKQGMICFEVIDG